MDGRGRARAAGVPVLALEDPASGAVEKVRAEIRRAIAEDGSECILLGCAGMADLARALTAEMGLPVIDGVAAAVKMAEGLIGLGLTTSKVAGYARPGAKPYTGRFRAGGLGLGRTLRLSCEWTCAIPVIAQRVHHNGEGGRRLAAARIIEMKA
jgi:hypothetical protein